MMIGCTTLITITEGTNLDVGASVTFSYAPNDAEPFERTRILVRMGPALGLMGTLIPLSPALAADKADFGASRIRRWFGSGDVLRVT